MVVDFKHLTPHYIKKEAAKKAAFFYAKNLKIMPDRNLSSQNITGPGLCIRKYAPNGLSHPNRTGTNEQF